MNRKKVELLSPAGDFETLIGAINAGADAIYLAGNKFGARAYAKNFSNEELIEAIDVAHLFGKKIYLTLNTLIKQNEFDELYDFLKPLNDKKLDGIIVQDAGVVNYVHKTFPDIEIHLSTQLSIMSESTPNYFKQFGVTRIVPARELSLAEIKNIKSSSNIEIECFIHGAMCYSYSGMCLFSSILGGRSGNRGRCAQPCRLPYSINDNKDKYLLSMKDMCTLNMIGDLIEAGIDSFKIEGRMKKPEYSAFVTSIYRKYIDEYYSTHHVSVSNHDIELLNNMYIRSERSEGYYHRHNSKDMITVEKPSYNGASDDVATTIRKKYIENKPKLDVCMDAYVNVNEPIILSVRYNDINFTIEGKIVDEALKTPMNEAQINKQIVKTGDTYFNVTECNSYITGNVFVPIKELNELRRTALLKLKEEIIECNLNSM